MPPPTPATAAAATAAAAPSLGQSYAAEVRVLDALMYRNRSQHGRAGYWKRLQVRDVGCFCLGERLDPSIEMNV